MIPIAASPAVAAAPAPTADDLVAAYLAFCPVADPSPGAIHDAAVRGGWIAEQAATEVRGEAVPPIALHAPPGRPMMTLTAHRIDQEGEQFFSCGVAAARELPALGSAVAGFTHAAPKVSFGGASTTFAVDDGIRWRDASQLPPADFAAAKSAGAFYAVMMQSGGGKASIFSLNIRADRARVGK